MRMRVIILVYVYVYMWYINECTCIKKIKQCTYFLVAVKSLSRKLCLHFCYVDCCKIVFIVHSGGTKNRTRASKR